MVLILGNRGMAVDAELHAGGILAVGLAEHGAVFSTYFGRANLQDPVLLISVDMLERDMNNGTSLEYSCSVFISFSIN